MSHSSPRLVFTASFYLILSLVCTQVPLLDYLGYEFSALVGIISSIIGGVYTIRVVRQALPSDDASRSGTVRVVTNAYQQSLMTNVALLAIPLVVITTNSIFVWNCSFSEGLVFFLLLTVVSVLFSCSLGFFCTVHYRHPRTVFILVFLGSLAYSLALGYVTPAIFSYNFFYGYFPGLTYDEVLGVSWTLVLFRLLTILGALTVVWWAVLILQTTSQEETGLKKGMRLLRAMARPRQRIPAGAVVLLFGLVYYFRGPLGLESSESFIQDRLGRRYESKHFLIFYSPDSFDDEQIKWVAAEHEFRLEQVLEVFKLPFRGKVESYIYPSSEVKRRLIGAGTTNIAKPWSGQVHLTKQTLDGTLKHELVHVLAAPFGLPVVRASLSTGLVEGLAMAIEWNWGNRTLHEYAAGMRRFGAWRDIEQLMSFTGFASQSSSVSYVLAGSFCRFLIDRYGIRKMMNVYRTLDYEASYARSFRQLVGEWEKFLDTIPLSDGDRDRIDVLFRRPPIFGKVCARVIAERNSRAREQVGTKDYRSAAALYAKSFAEADGYEALGGYLTSSLKAKDHTAVTAALDTIIMKDQNPAQYLPLFVAIGDAAWAQGDTRKATHLYDRVSCADFSGAHTEAALVRLLALRENVHSSDFLEYFLSDEEDSVKLVALITGSDSTSRIAQYLRGRVLSRLGKQAESVAVLRGLDMTSMDARLEAVRLRTIGASEFRQKKFQDAKASFWLSLNHVGTDAALSEVTEWVERCEWMSNNFLP